MRFVLDPTATRVMRPGTPARVVGADDFNAALPWRSRPWLSPEVELPSVAMTDAATSDEALIRVSEEAWHSK